MNENTWYDTTDGYLGMDALLEMACDADLRRTDYAASLAADYIRLCDIIRWVARTSRREPDNT